MSEADEDALREALDDRVRDVLDEHGDDGTTPRHTLFYFYGGDLVRLTAAAAAAGYTVCPAHGKPGAILECTMAVDEAHFEPAIAQMTAWAEDFDCAFDGWECQLLVN